MKSKKIDRRKHHVLGAEMTSRSCPWKVFYTISAGNWSGKGAFHSAAISKKRSADCKSVRLEFAKSKRLAARLVALPISSLAQGAFWRGAWSFQATLPWLSRGRKMKNAQSKSAAKIISSLYTPPSISFVLAPRWKFAYLNFPVKETHTLNAKFNQRRSQSGEKALLSFYFMLAIYQPTKYATLNIM